MATATDRKNGTLKLPERILEEIEGSDIFLTKRGIKLRLIPVPSDVVAEAHRRVPLPEPPMVPIPDRPGQTEPHYGDMKYLQAMDEYQEVKNDLTFQIGTAYGVVAYHVPEGMYGPDDEGWVEMTQEEDVFTVKGKSYKLDIPGSDKPRAHFAAWVRFYAISQDDIKVYYDALLHGMGQVLEKDVEEAVDSFPSPS